MSAPEPPLSKAHRHAAYADEALSQGLLMKSRDEHYRAADAFLICVNGSTNENTKHTLRLLSEEHRKQGIDLTRRIETIRGDGGDPSLPQPPLPASVNPSSSPPSNSNRLRTTPGTVDDSFMMLPGQSNELSSSFGQFWKVLEGMLDQLSQPVAFATTPLHPHNRQLEGPRNQSPGSNAQGCEAEDPDAKNQEMSSTESNKSDDLDESWELDDDYVMAESFYLIPHEEKTPATRKNQLEQLEERNRILQSRLLQATEQIANFERVIKDRLGHEQQLRDSILQAQRVMNSSQIFNSMHIGKSLGPDRPRENQITALPSSATARIAELEEKIRMLYVQDVTQKATIAKYKERWDKVKESMRRKKAAKVATQIQLTAERNRIDEEIEPE